VWGVQPTLKLERQFQRSTGADLAIRPERTYTTKATCFEYPSAATLVRFCRLCYNLTNTNHLLQRRMILR
jgi:hypothetical protein